MYLADLGGIKRRPVRPDQAFKKKIEECILLFDSIHIEVH